MRRELERFRGREIDTAGDGFLATFDGPARADPLRHRDRDARAASSASRSARGCTPASASSDGKIARHRRPHRRPGGGLAGSGEVLVSSTVKDLVAGSGLEFEDRGVHGLKGVPGEWRLFAAHSE